MKLILRIARTELYTLFFSPIAWLILIVFACQVGVNYLEILGEIVRIELLGRGIKFSVTAGLLLGGSGLYETIQQSLYMYVPLLTMGLISRELASGSIKLLYSSPVTTLEIILGKYLSMVVYSLILVFILFLPVLHIMFAVPDYDIGLALTGLLGLFLLTCSYCAIGLFMSCLTSYQVVAAVATLSTLAFLNFVGSIGQGSDFFREITYWLSISGRASEMVGGIVCSDDVIYFVSVISVFLAFASIKLYSEKSRVSKLMIGLRYLTALIVMVSVGYLSSRPQMLSFYDATNTKARTLTIASQEIINQLDGDLTMTTFCNVLDQEINLDIAFPLNIKKDESRFKKYVRFKPEMKLDYIYYYAPPVDKSIYNRFPNMTDKEIAMEVADKKGLSFKKVRTLDEINKIVDLKPEEYRFVRMFERENGKRAFLRIYNDMFRHPDEQEITTTLKKLIVEPVKVGFLVGHGERDLDKNGDRDYSTFASSLPFRQSMINQGFDVITINLNDIDNIPSDINIMLIADMKKALNEHENSVLDRYIERGDNLAILTDVGRQNSMNPLVNKFGINIDKGIIAQPSELFAGNLVTAVSNEKAAANFRFYNYLLKYNLVVPMLGATSLSYDENADFKYIPLLSSPEGKSWIEYETTNFIEDTVRLNPSIGEKYGSFVTSVSATRFIGEKEQRVIVLGDADCISNSELFIKRNGIRSNNFSMITGMFRWLSNDVFPISLSRLPNIDTKLKVNVSSVRNIRIIYIYVVPLLFALLGIFIWWKRRGR